MSLPASPLRLLPTAATFVGWDFHPLKFRAFSRRTMDAQDENQKARQKHEKTSNGSESIHHRPRVVTPATLKPQHCAGQPDSGFLKVFVTFSANVIENQPII